MTDDVQPPPAPPHLAHGQVGYLQLPALDVGRSIEFYHEVFGWRGETEWAAFEAPGLIGQWVTDRAPAPEAGPVLWLMVDDLRTTLAATVEHGGSVLDEPTLDQGERWLATLGDPAGNPIGVVQPVRPVRPQPLLAVADVEAASAWYQQLLGLRSDHGGPDYERLLSQGRLVLQLHRWEAEHDHGPIGVPTDTVGNGALVWFEVEDFDAVVERAAGLGATVVMAPHRNPPEGPGGPDHREIWLRDLDGYTVVAASPDGESSGPGVS